MVPTHVQDPPHITTLVGTYLTSWFILSVLFFDTVVPTSHGPLVTSWFIMSVLFLTFSETSVVPSHVQDSPSHIPPPW